MLPLKPYFWANFQIHLVHPVNEVKQFQTSSLASLKSFNHTTVGMVFANCSVIEMIDHSKGLRNVKKHIYRCKKLPVLFAAMTTISVASVGVMSYMQMSNTSESDAIAEVAYPMGLTDRVQARPFGEMRTGLEDVACIGVCLFRCT